MRGTPDRRSEHHAISGIIPHMRGHKAQAKADMTGKGSIPAYAGTLADLLCEGDGSGIIPAYAGNTRGFLF